MYIYILNCFFIITSSSRQFHNKIDALKQIFKLSRYSIQFVDRCMKQFLQKFYLNKAAQDTVNKKQLLIVLPFLGSQSFLVRNNTVCYELFFTPKLDFPVCFVLILFRMGLSGLLTVGEGTTFVISRNTDIDCILIHNF